MRTILITGFNSEIASSYVKENEEAYDLIIAHYGHRKNRVEELMVHYGSKIIPICADLSNVNDVEKLVAKLRDFEINEYLHIAAPSLHHMRFAQGRIQEFELEMQVVFWSFLRICQCIIPGMVKRGEGRILAILTEYTVTNQPPYLSHYISSKFALLGLVKSLASEYAAKGIRVNGISPGMIETDFISKLPQYVIDDNAKATLRGRNLNSADLIPTIDFLMSEKSTGINGQNILLQ